MISIPSIIGIEYDYSWKEMIINSALNGKRFNYIGYIFKNKILNENDECDNIKIALIIAFQYHYKEIISIFKDKSNIEDLIPSNDYDYEYEYDDINENQIIDYWDDWKNWDLYEEWDYQQYWHYYFQETDNWKEEDQFISQRIKTAITKNHSENRDYKKRNNQKKKNYKKKKQNQIRRKISNEDKEYRQELQCHQTNYQKCMFC